MGKIKESSLPTISVVTPSYSGSLVSLEKCLEIVRSQDYPQDKIEIILGHGGIKSEIEKIANKYKAKFVLISSEKQNAEYNRGVAFNKAKNELVLILDHDNYMPDDKFLKQYVRPFIEDKDVVAVESCFYHYDPQMPVLDRYFALFGVLDPVPLYFGKADRMKWRSNSWNLKGDWKDKGEYYIVKFDSNPRNIPTLGTNGCIMRRKVVIENADTRIGHHYPIDVMVDVIRSGHNKFAFTKNSISHLTGSRGIFSFIKRRLKFMQEYHFEDTSKRRYSVYMSGDFWNLAKFILYSLTFIKPIFDALRGFLVTPDFAWFLHPAVCFFTCFAYGYVTIKVGIVKLMRKNGYTHSKLERY